MLASFHLPLPTRRSRDPHWKHWLSSYSHTKIKSKRSFSTNLTLSSTLLILKHLHPDQFRKGSLSTCCFRHCDQHKDAGTCNQTDWAAASAQLLVTTAEPVTWGCVPVSGLLICLVFLLENTVCYSAFSGIQCYSITASFLSLLSFCVPFKETH